MHIISYDRKRVVVGTICMGKLLDPTIQGRLLLLGFLCTQAPAVLLLRTPEELLSGVAHAGQINDSMAENMELQAAAEGANAQCQLLEGQAAQLQTGELWGLEGC